MLGKQRVPSKNPPRRRASHVNIFLIRHGETADNARGVVQMPDIPLSPRGRAQAAQLGRRLAAEGVAHILASDYARAAMTADAVRAATQAEIEPWKELRERNYGDLRGRPYTEIGEYILMEGYEPPNGESWDVFHERVDRAWARVVMAAEVVSGNLAVVTHGLVLHSLALRHLTLPRDTDVPARFGNTSLTVIDGEHPYPVRLLDCCEHLETATVDNPRH